jgi:uncharacterized protein YjiS (DUF1127 family)
MRLNRSASRFFAWLLEVLVVVTEDRILKLRTCPTLTTLIFVWPITRLRRLLLEWERRRVYRSNLERLLRVGEHMIKDIGLTLDAARHEIDKPFWQA